MRYQQNLKERKIAIVVLTSTTKGMDSSPTLDDVYRKFGEASEAAQLLETELGTLLLWEQDIAEDLLDEDRKRAAPVTGETRLTPEPKFDPRLS